MISDSVKEKKLLILGGIKDSIEIIERAHKAGMLVYVTDYYSDSPAKAYADKSFMVSATDIDAVVELCKKEGIDGICVSTADRLLPYYAQICEHLGFFSYGTYEQFKIMTDKKRFKNICKEYNVPTILEYTFEEMENNSELFPVIIKPVDSSSSRGISVCKNISELRKGIEKALSFSPSERYIIEKYMDGPEVVMYYYCQDGNPVFATMCDRYVDRFGDVAPVPTGYIFPSKYISNHLNETDKRICSMIKGIGIKNGPIFLQAFIENGIPYIYEPGYRLNGARDQYIVEPITGVNSMDMLINYSITGRMADVDIGSVIDPMLKGKFGCKLSPYLCTGTVSKIEGIDEALKIKGVNTIVKYNEIGNTIEEKHKGTLFTIAYRAFILSDSIEELKDTIQNVQNCVKYYDENGNNMIVGRFNTRILNDYR